MWKHNVTAGQQFGRWTVLDADTMLCRCACGRKSIQERSRLVRGASVQCRACSRHHARGERSEARGGPAYRPDALPAHRPKDQSAYRPTKGEEQVRRIEENKAMAQFKSHRVKVPELKVQLETSIGQVQMANDQDIVIDDREAWVRFLKMMVRNLRSELKRAAEAHAHRKVS